MKAISVVLIEPQTIFLKGVVKDLEAASDINVIQTTHSGLAGIELVRHMSPDVAVTALQVEDLDEVPTELKEMFGSTKTLVLTADNREELIFECMMLGAQGCLFKWGVIDLAESIRRAHAGEFVLCPQSLRGFILAVRGQQTKQVESVQHPNLLTPREREILELIGIGRDQPQIADDLALSRHTVKAHLRNTYAKLGVNRSAAAVQEALRRGLIDRRRNNGH